MSTGAVHGLNDASFLTSGAVIAYSPVKLHTSVNTVVLADAVTDRTFGIAQNASTGTGGLVAVRTSGFSLAKIGAGGCAIGDKLTPATGSTLIATTTAGDFICAEALAAASANEFAEVKIIPTTKYSAVA